MKQALKGRVQFGAFELDPQAGELHRNGERAVLREQQLKVLLMLIEREGVIATREEIKKRLWPNDTIVEFDHSINNTIKNLRRVLGDSAETPAYIETVARRGYRLMVSVEWFGADSSSASDSIANADSDVLPKASLTVGPLIGKVVSHYRVLEVIGGGCMGLVYRAEDLKLGRSVALKFLPEEIGNETRARERFEREAHAVSALNHTNICTIYDFDEHERHPFIAMELLQGKTLRDHLADGHFRLTQPEGLDIAIQISSGLEAAHEKGIIHRDIKPANIFITEKNVAKILDFGLAKMVEAPDFSLATSDGVEKGRGFSHAVGAHFQDEPGTQSHVGFIPAQSFREAGDGAPEGPLIQTAKDTATVTRTGVKPGTAGYMSPEQVRGEPLDARTDIFSFGLVLYEMATGERAFTGETEAILHDAIRHRDPKPVGELAPTVSTALAETIEKCLEKEPEQRFQAASELRSALLEAQHTSLPVVRQPLAEDKPAASHRKLWVTGALSAALLVAVVATTIYRRAYSAPKLTEKDTVVLANFENKTGDAVFDGTLRMALAIQLEQSPFLNVLSEQRVNGTLKLMGRSANEPLTSEVAREVCLRTNSKAMLQGSIAPVGEHYLIAVKAVNCGTGDTLTSAEADAENRNKVLKALNQVGNQLRGMLGESLASMKKFDQPLEEATTSSVEALQDYTRARRARLTGDTDPIPYLKHALELDPNFAEAYARLGPVYEDMKQSSLAIENYNKAYELRNKVSQRERFYIEAHYYADATGQLEKAIPIFKEWIQTYPGAWEPHVNLSYHYIQLGQYEMAAEEARTTIRLVPDSVIAYRHLVEACDYMDQPDKATAALNEVFIPKLDDNYLHLGRYETAFLEGDNAAMQQEIAWATGKPGAEDLLLSAQSETEAYYGRFEKARDFSRRVAEAAEHADAPETAGLWRADEALREAEIGNLGRARQLAGQALSLSAGRDVEVLAALALARAGNAAAAQNLVDKLDSEFPVDTIMQGHSLPTIRASIELDRNNPLLAIKILQVASSYEMGAASSRTLYPPYLRGQAYLKAGQGKHATAEFQKLLDHRGLVGNFVLGALVHLQSGRAYAMQDNTAKAKAAYQDFLALWKDADPDIPIYKQAKAEYAKLK
jgi:serine/threonine protein kinase/predicted Zn-dependent protease